MGGGSCRGGAAGRRRPGRREPERRRRRGGPRPGTAGRCESRAWNAWIGPWTGSRETSRYPEVRDNGTRQAIFYHTGKQADTSNSETACLPGRAKTRVAVRDREARRERDASIVARAGKACGQGGRPRGGGGERSWRRRRRAERRGGEGRRRGEKRRRAERRG